ncbi:hypothetical protein CONCODRAFT_87972 [Conidiobolus coronatus NRRL 28638]|uniref:Biogenesis of lysosome-related organelles complex 1 subunit 2 n=1 Tax=Conidiobolus coronatus (strain ATCC 28846 / CBS 209.66 / NRRL 28638) TaxID=796925 RepID=A0A137NQF5_CONC2|nr:hypothetical protein CONCODRAFT_87972 [Conidiobolus coronatus NRRL 28638]|eukprot:KXN64996.1 hypothetical protein CONCODRAFT_87972 [Conidiobolus coronatus NRRL 28638]
MPTVNPEEINESVDYLTSKLTVIPSSEKLTKELNSTLQKSNNLVQEVSKLEENFNSIDTVELNSIHQALQTLEQTYSEIDAYEVIINGVIEKVNKIDVELAKEEQVIKNLRDPLFSQLPFIKK